MKMKKYIACIAALVMMFTLFMGFQVMAQEPAAEEGTAEAAAAGEESVLPDRINIVLFGLSGDNGGLDTNRTDSIIIITFDNEYRQLKFTSILRDIKAEIEGHEPQKINAAYRYGGPELALKTLNDTFGLELEDYVTVNFDQFSDIINQLGGTTVELTQAEADYLNEDLPGSNLTAGVQHLDGLQTLEYSRIRKIDSDVERSGRQRNVLADLVKTVNDMNLKDFLEMTAKMVEEVESTSMTREDLDMILMIPFGEYDIINNHFPDYDLDVNVEGGIDEHGEWVWWFDHDAAKERINDIIYNEQPVEESEEDAQ